MAAGPIDGSASPADAYPLLIKQLLHSARSSAGAQQIVYRDRLRLRYSDLFERIGRLANALQTLGVRPGMTVAMMDWDSHRYLEAFFAVPMMGAVLQTVNVRLSPEQIGYTLEHAQADVLLVHHDFLPLLDAIRPQLARIQAMVLIADDTGLAAGEGFSGEYELLLQQAAADFEFPDFDENTRATTFYTTGTTGLPKGVFFSHRQLVLHTLATATALCSAARHGRLHRADVYMPITPMFHVHAWGVPYIATMLGIRQVYPGRYDPAQLLGLIAREGVTFMHGVPTVLHMLLHAPGSADVDLRGCKMIIGGSALPRGLAQQALERGMDVFTGYGMSETCPILTLAQPAAELADDDVEAQLDARTQTGRAIPLVDLRVVDDTLHDVARDGSSVGEVVVRAPWLTAGYWRNPQASAALWEGGYLHTGDIGMLGADGMLRVTDRLKDVIKSGGEWVSSLELESAISRHPAVSEVAVVGRKDPKWGERPLAFVVLKAGQQSSADAIRQHVQALADQGLLSRYAVPDEVRFVDQLARTSVGKLNKKAMRAQLAGDDQTAPD